MEPSNGLQTFSSIAGGITDPAQSQSQTQQSETQASPPADIPVLEDPPSPAKRPVGRPKGSKNKAPHTTLDLDPELGKRPVGRPRGSGKKKEEAESVQAKRPVGRPRKDGLPSGSAKSTSATQSVSAFPSSISAPAGPVVEFAVEHNEWARLAYSKPDDFLYVLLAALDPPNAAPSSGPSVEEAFKSHLGSLAPPPNSSGSSSANGHTQTIPSLYSILKTFWLPASPSYFALTASATSARTPASHRFLYWDPQPLVFNGIACPACTAPLTNRGRIRSGPLTVHDLAGPFFVIGCTYACANDHVYASTDASVRRALPAALEREFPARLLAGDAGAGMDVWNWQARGVSRALWNLVLGALRAGLARDVILQLVRNVQHGVPESGGGTKQETNVAPAGMPMEEEEESAEEAAQGRRDADAVMTVPEPATPSAAQAFNDAWTANSVVASTSASAAGHGAILNPFSMVFPQSVPSGMAFDPTQRKRPYPFGDDMVLTASAGVGPAPAPESPPTKQRAPRHCCKCGSQSCKGKGGRNFCTSACMDCGKFTCRGRNSRRPDKRCDSAGEAPAVGVPALQDPTHGLALLQAPGVNAV